MLVICAFNNCQSTFSSIKGGVSNGLIYSNLAFENIDISACGPDLGL